MVMTAKRAVVGVVVAATLWVVTRPERGVAFEREGAVVRASGIDLSRGEACTVAVSNQSRGGYPCRVTVVCGGVTLYGGPQLGGYAECSARRRRWVRATDDQFSSRDGDPWLDLDVDRGTAVVRTERMTVEVALGRVLREGTSTASEPGPRGGMSARGPGLR